MNQYQFNSLNLIRKLIVKVADLPIEKFEDMVNYQEYNEDGVYKQVRIQSSIGMIQLVYNESHFGKDAYKIIVVSEGDQILNVVVREEEFPLIYSSLSNELEIIESRYYGLTENKLEDLVEKFNKLLED